MASFDDEFNQGRDHGAEATYRVGNKRPPLHSRFKSGISGNPNGRPKDRPKGYPILNQTLTKELSKSVSATVNGKPVTATNGEPLAVSLVKNAITKGPAAMALLLKVIQQLEPEAAAAEARKKGRVRRNARRRPR